MDDGQLKWRKATSDDADVLAAMNARLIQDERHRNRLTVAALADRMREWVLSDYEAVLFDDRDEVVAYALYRLDEDGGIYLRQFFVERQHRRRGIGRRAMTILVSNVWAKGARVTVEVLTGNPSGLAFWRAIGFSDYAIVLERTERYKAGR
jgi:GNAT superfamily N-acetyltransferase